MADSRLEIMLAARDASKAAFSSVRGRISALSKSMLSLSAGAVAVGGPAGLGYLIKQSLNAADAIGKAADVIGIHTSTLQEYRHAASLSGVDTGLLEKSLIAFTKRVGEAKEGTGPLVTFMRKYDETLLHAVTSSDNMSDALELIFNRMGEMTNQADRAALANAAFSRSGVRLTNLVKNGADGLREMRAEAQRLGLVIGDDLIRNSEAANDQLDKLGRVLKTNVQATLIRLAPDIIEVSTSMLKWIEQNQKFIAQDIAGYMDEATKAVKEAGSAVGTVVKIYQKLPDEVIGVAGAGVIGRILFGATPAGKIATGVLMINEAMKSFNMDVESLIRKYEELNQAVLNVWDVMTGKRDPNTGELINQGPVVIRHKMPPGQLPPGAGGTGDDLGGSGGDDIADDLGGSGAAVPDWSRVQDFGFVETTGGRAAGIVRTMGSIEAMREASEDAFRDMTEDLTEYEGFAVKTFDEIDMITDSIFSQMGAGLADFVTQGEKDFGRLADSIINDLFRIGTQAAISGIFGMLFPGVSAGAASFMGPGGVHLGRGGTTAFGMQGGGHIGENVVGVGIQSGRSYEFHANETVIPDDKLGGGNVTIVINNNSGIPATMREEMFQGDKRIMVEIGNNVIGGGVVAKSIGQYFGLQHVGKHT